MDTEKLTQASELLQRAAEPLQRGSPDMGMNRAPPIIAFPGVNWTPP